MDPPLRQRLAYVRDHLRTNWISAAGFALLYLLFNIATTLYIHRTVAAFYSSMLPSYTIPFTIFTILLSAAFGIAAMLFIVKLREIRLKSAGFGLTGILFGGLAAGCPGCYFGLFPVLLSLFGISATLAILPFNGLELQVLGVLAMALAIVTLAKETAVTCDLPARQATGRHTPQKRKK